MDLKLKVTLNDHAQSTALAFLTHALWCHVFHSRVLRARVYTCRCVASGVTKY